MASRTAAEVLADITGSVVRQADVHDVLNRLLQDSLELLGAEMIGVMVIPADGGLELLGATSHAEVQLELFSMQSEAGPCLDAIGGNAVVVCHSPEQLGDRWDGVGDAIVAAGYASLMALPVRWRGRVFGSLIVFRRAREVDDDTLVLGQAVADVISLVLVHTVAVTTDEVAKNLHPVIAGRAVIEQAKGVLAYQRGVGPAAAYEALQQISRARGLPLTTAAENVLRTTGGGAAD